MASLEDLDQRIAIVRDNIRELTEQAAAYSGAQDGVARRRPHCGARAVAFGTAQGTRGAYRQRASAANLKLQGCGPRVKLHRFRR